VHAAKYREKHHTQVNEGLELGVLRRVGRSGKLVDDHREAVKTAIGPHDLAEKEWVDRVALVNRIVDYPS